MTASRLARNADTAHGGSVDRAFQSRVARGRQEIRRALHIGLVEFFRMGSPQTIVGGHVENDTATGDGSTERFGIAKIAYDRFDIEFRDGLFADQRANTMTFFEEQPGDMPPDKACRAGNQRRLHGR